MVVVTWRIGVGKNTPPQLSLTTLYKPQHSHTHPYSHSHSCILHILQIESRGRGARRTRYEKKGPEKNVGWVGAYWDTYVANTENTNRERPRVETNMAKYLKDRYIMNAFAPYHRDGHT